MTMEDIQFYIDHAEELMDKSVEHLRQVLIKIRAGKAMPNMLDGIMVEYYGSPTPINQVATINTPDATEAYQAMESGVVDTVAFAQHAHLSFGTINQADWWTANLNPGTVNCPVVVNIDAYEGLSAAHKEAFDSSIDEAIAHYLSNYGELLQKWDSILVEKNVKKVMIDPAVIEDFKAAAAVGRT